MPVEDHAVHPSTRIGPDFRYPCWNGDRDFKGYFAPNREYDNRHGTWGDGKTFIPYRLTRPCQYDKSAGDPACRGCKHIMKG